MCATGCDGSDVRAQISCGWLARCLLPTIPALDKPREGLTLIVDHQVVDLMTVVH